MQKKSVVILPISLESYTYNLTLNAVGCYATFVYNLTLDLHRQVIRDWKKQLKFGDFGYPPHISLTLTLLTFSVTIVIAVSST